MTSSRHPSQYESMVAMSILRYIIWRGHNKKAMVQDKIFGMIKKLGFSVSCLMLATGFLASIAKAGPHTPDPAFDASRLTENGQFTAKNAMTASDIQSFLNKTPFGNRSCLANYSEGGRSAAQIIYDYTRGIVDPPLLGGIDRNPRDVSIHPGAILVTLQKEMGLISAPDAICPENRLRVAMGYGCPDGGGCEPSYYGFLNQVMLGAWQLDRNFDCADGSDSACSPYLVGNTLTLNNTTDYYNVPSTQQVVIGNRATGALYRYTPHVFNGNYNFWRYFRLWFPTYSAHFVSQNGYPTLIVGQPYNFQLTLRNTGGATWQKGIVNLGTDRGQDRIPGFIREGGHPSGWLKENRIEMVEASVAPGETGTFSFWYTVPAGKAPGIYREYFRPVADGISWLEDWGIYWDVRIVSLPDSFRARFHAQNGYPTLKRNQSYQFEVKLENTGVSTWHKGIVNLGTDRSRDRIPGFIREDRIGASASGWLKENRIELVESSVPPGGVGTFRFWYTVPPDKAFGAYREYFRPVADHITWMDDWGIYWDVTVVP